MRNHAFMRLCAVLGISSVAAMASADTIYFTDGSSLSGRVTQSSTGDYVLEVKGGRMYFDAATVARVDRDEREGEYNLLAVHQRQAGASATDAEATVDESAPALSPEEAEKVSEILKSFSSENALDVAAAKEALRNFESEGDLFQFLQDNLNNLEPAAADGALDVMTEMDPVKARDVLSSRATEGSPESRIKAIEMMAESPEAADLDALRESITDADPQVQLAAAEALAASGDKAATDALLSGLRSADMRVRAAAEAALRELWADDPAAAQMQSEADWDRFWANREADVAAAAEADAAAEDGAGEPAVDAAGEDTALAQDTEQGRGYNQPVGRSSQNTEWITESASTEEVPYLPNLRQQTGTTNNPVKAGAPSGVVINKDARMPEFHRGTRPRGESPTQQKVNFDTEDSTPRLPDRYTDDEN